MHDSRPVNKSQRQAQAGNIFRLKFSNRPAVAKLLAAFPNGATVTTFAPVVSIAPALAARKAIELTLFAKTGGPLTKQISLNDDGTVKSDGSACVMSTGRARRVRVSGVDDLSDLIGRLRTFEALALGVLRDGLPDEVEIVTKDKLLSGRARNDVIARTSDAIIYREDAPAFALIDLDTKGMPSTSRRGSRRSAASGRRCSVWCPN